MQKKKKFIPMIKFGKQHNLLNDEILSIVVLFYNIYIFMLLKLYFHWMNISVASNFSQHKYYFQLLYYLKSMTPIIFTEDLRCQ